MKNAIVLLSSMLLAAHAATLAQAPGGWSRPLQISNGQGPKQGLALAIGRNGHVFVLWQEYNQPSNDLLAQLFLAEFDGNAWHSPVAITDTGRMDWTPDLALDTSGHPHVVWGEYLSAEVFYKYCDGVKWSEPVNVSQASGGSFFPQLAIDRTNTVHVVWHDRAYDDDPSVFYRSFDGRAWSEKTVVSDTLQYSAFPKIALDSHNNPHVVFCSRQEPQKNENWEVFYRNRTNGLWSSIARLTTDTLPSTRAVIALRSDDRPVVLWEQLETWLQSPNQVRVYWSEFDGTRWTPGLPMSNVSEDKLIPSVSVDSNDIIHAAWQRMPGYVSDAVFYAHYAGGAWSAPEDISSILETQMAAAPVIKADTRDNLHVVFLASDLRGFIQIYYTLHGPTTGVRDAPPPLHDSFELKQNYPNPFNGRTIITFSLPRREFVSVRVFNVLGEEVATLVSGLKDSGMYTAVFDGTRYPSGVYFCRLESSSSTVTKKLLLVR
jgi:hypothetical protein